MSKHQHYLGISIGPIYDTLTQARKTRELWVGSYLFSMLMKALLEAVNELGADAGCKVLSPVPSSNPEAPLFGAGVYPDRLFVGLNRVDDNLVQQVKAQAIEAIIASVENNKPYASYAGGGDLVRFPADIRAFWKNFFRIVHVFVNREEILDQAKEEAKTEEEKKNPTPNVLKSLNDRLDTLELQPVYFSDEPPANGVLHLLETPYPTQLAQDALLTGTAYTGLVGTSRYQNKKDEWVDVEHFPSTAEIASLELFQREPKAYKALQLQAQENIKIAKETHPEKYRGKKEDDEDGLVWREFFRLLFERDTELKALAHPYHRYFCIVHADGDSFGEVIKALKEETEKADDLSVTNFSRKVADFAVTASATINRFGGKPVYIGGDDLVFFAPVVSLVGGERKSVFHLLEALNEDFDALSLPASPSMSYGVALAHYKFPLFEARDMSYTQLDYRAKKAKWDGKQKKDTTGFRLLKHSGSYFEGILSNERLLAAFNELSDLFINGKDLERKEAVDSDDLSAEEVQSANSRATGNNRPATLLSSFAFKLRELEVLVREAAADSARLREGADEAPADALASFFENFFNEPLHRKRYRAERDKIEAFTRLVYGTSVKVDGKETPQEDNFYALLRLLDFLTPKTKPDAKNI